MFELLAPAAKTPLIDQFVGLMAENSLMAPDQLIAAALKGLQQDQAELYPGQSAGRRFMSRLAPGFMLRQLSKPYFQAFGPPNS